MMTCPVGFKSQTSNIKWLITKGKNMFFKKKFHSRYLHHRLIVDLITKKVEAQNEKRVTTEMHNIIKNN